jgi:glycerol-3-phosphate acyltransferase PlsY
LSEALLVFASYLLGSVSSSLWVVRALTGRDVREIGSGNAGATNVLRAAGRAPALLVLTLDVAKGAIPVLLARRLGAAETVVAACAVAAVVGHVFPLFHGLRGGKGVATAAGALSAMSPLAAVGVVPLFLGLVAWKRYVSLGSVVAAILFPVAIWVAERWAADARAARAAEVAAAIIAVLILLRHRENLARLWAGTERRLGGMVEAASRLGGGAAEAVRAGADRELGSTSSSGKEER